MKRVVALRLLLSLLVLPNVVPGGWSQATSPSPNEIPAPTIRVSTHLVLVDAVVTDKEGKAIPGLRPEDFEVDENGKAQKISTFMPAGEKTAAPQSLPPGIYSNRPQYRMPGGPITILLLDGLNTPFKDQAYARRQMLRFVQEQYRPGQRMAIFTLTGSVRVLQDFTSDPQILATALQRYMPQAQQMASAVHPATSIAAGTPSAESNTSATDASVPPLGNSGSHDAGLAPVQAGLQAFESAQTAYQEDQQVVLTLNALNSLARILGGMPGRKNLVWVTGKVPFSLIPENRSMSEAELTESLPSLDSRRVSEHAAGNNAATLRQSHAEEIRETASRLSSAQVSIYPIDARGLALVDDRGLAISADSDSQGIMREMARETGGRAYVNQNEIKDGVERALRDESATYTLGYYPENKKYDGKYRDIRVKVKRDGVDIQYRRGYFAMDPLRVKGHSSDQEVASALGDALPSTLIAFTARVLPAADNLAAKGKVGVDFLVDATTLSAASAGTGKELNVAFYAAVYSPAGKILGNRSMKVDQTFDLNAYQQIVQHGLLLHMDLDPQPGSNQLRLAVQDNATGLVGSLGAPMPQ